MPSRNFVLLEGHVTRDPESKALPSGDMVVEFGVATSDKWRKDGEWKEKVVWHNIKAYKYAADAAMKLEKGDLITLTGKIGCDEWNDKETGKKRTKYYVTANDVHFMRHKNGHGEATQGSGSPDDDDLPF